MVLGPMRGCWSLQPCLAGPICYTSEQTSASADAGRTSPLHCLTDGNHLGARPSQNGIPRAGWEIAGPKACPVLAHMAQSVVYADLRFAKVIGGRSMASQALEAGESPWDASCCPQHAQPHGLSRFPRLLPTALGMDEAESPYENMQPVPDGQDGDGAQAQSSPGECPSGAQGTWGGPGADSGLCFRVLLLPSLKRGSAHTVPPVPSCYRSTACSQEVWRLPGVFQLTR